jgi:DNA-binding PadR family transcriptional regulator
VPGRESALMPIEIFLLFCAKTGMVTPYAILSRTGVAVGASSPALRRLEQEGLLTSEPGPRNKSSYHLTAKGEAGLRNALNGGLKVYGRPTPRGIYESLHRILFFAWIKGMPNEAYEAISQAEENLKRKLMRANVEAAECRRILSRSKIDFIAQHNPDSVEFLSAGYRLIGAEAEAAEAKMLIVALGDLQKLVGELPPCPSIYLNDLPSQTATSMGSSNE